jgi:hypothetical protein
VKRVGAEIHRGDTLLSATASVQRYTEATHC